MKHAWFISLFCFFILKFLLPVDKQSEVYELAGSVGAVGDLLTRLDCCLWCRKKNQKKTKKWVPIPAVPRTSSRGLQFVLSRVNMCRVCSPGLICKSNLHCWCPSVRLPLRQSVHHTIAGKPVCSPFKWCQTHEGTWSPGCASDKYHTSPLPSETVKVLII